jgi:hypothetical protein
MRAWVIRVATPPTIELVPLRLMTVALKRVRPELLVQREGKHRTTIGAGL